MPASYSIDTGRRAIFIRAWGTLTEAEALAASAALVADPAFSADFVRMENLTGITNWTLSSSFVAHAAKRHRASPPPKRAYIVSSDVAYGMVRMLQMLADAAPDRMLVTRDVDEAFRWVGLDAAAGWPD